MIDLSLVRPLSNLSLSSDNESNTERFRSLSQHLEKSNTSLLVKANLRGLSDVTATPHFLVMTSPTGHLLLKVLLSPFELEPARVKHTSSIGGGTSLILRNLGKLEPFEFTKILHSSPSFL